MSDDIGEHLRELELRLLQSEFRRNVTEVAALLANDFVEVGSSGRIFDKEAVLRSLDDEPPRPAEMMDFSAHPLTPAAWLLRWRAVRPDGTDSLRSSVWVLRDGKWQTAFHQGTAVPPISNKSLAG